MICGQPARRSPPDRASAVPYGQAGENAMRFPPLAHRSAAAHKLHSTTATTRSEFDSGNGETISRLPALAYSSPEAVQTTGTGAVSDEPDACVARGIIHVDEQTPADLHKQDRVLSIIGNTQHPDPPRKLDPLPIRQNSNVIILGL